MKAAGILFISPQGNGLFLRRGANAPDYPGYWDLPGGGQENDETSQETALREAAEEIGDVPKGDIVFHTRTKGSALKGVAGHGAPVVQLPVAAGAPAAPNSTIPDNAVDFTTFVQHVDEQFEPKINGEHDAAAWVPTDNPPEPLHPGSRIALDRLNMDELGVARAIADGRLTSPQRYENVWLFAIRITGTDVAFRPKAEEFVLRKPEHYLTEEFLARCNGLPVIFRHPASALLNSEEFSNRVVGTVFLPYIAGDEVWAVAKIYVDDVAQMMKKGELSTSPGVNFADFSVNAKMTIADGSKVLIEGKPSLLDHIAICTLGVWDKGGDPTGIRSESREDSTMSTEAEEKAKKDAAEAEQKAKDDAAKKDADEKAEAEAKAKKDAEDEEKKKADADAGTPLDKTLKFIADSVKSCADSIANIGKRVDEMEMDSKSRRDAEEEEKRKKGDPEQLKADAAKKDAEEAEKKAKDDAMKADAAEKAKADSADIRKRIDEVASMIPKDANDADYHAMTDAQARADEVFADFGMRAPRPQQGETPSLYERRCVRMLKEHSPTWKGADVGSKAFADDTSFAIVRDQVYREAKQTAMNPVNVPHGQLRMIEKKRDGHTIREFVGDPRSWMDPMAGATQLRGTGSFMHGNLGKN